MEEGGGGCKRFGEEGRGGGCKRFGEGREGEEDVRGLGREGKDGGGGTIVHRQSFPREIVPGLQEN